MSLQQPNKHLLELADKWLSGKITEEEKLEFDQWYNSFNDASGSLISNETEMALEERIQYAIFEKADINVKKPSLIKSIPTWLRIAAAAIILFILSAALHFLGSSHSSGGEYMVNTNSKQDVAPGSNKAFLVLADGSRISLTDAANGKIAKQAGVTITKSANGQLIYKVTAQTSSARRANTESNVYNTIETPRGGQYQIDLPDGTKVWLNAASSLKYPIVFANNERRVELTGEAYFEVAKVNVKSLVSGIKTERRMPFIVKTAKQKVEVLGTHFNINSYADEPSTKTTLLEGSVRVVTLSLSKGKVFQQAQGDVILKPGQQSLLSDNGNIGVEPVDAEAAIAWKNGFFHFQNADVYTVLRQLSRWYNVDVVYQTERLNDEFVGDIPKTATLATALKILDLGGIHFKIDGRKIIVTK